MTLNSPIKQAYKRIETTISAYLCPSESQPLSNSSNLPMELIELFIDEAGFQMASSVDNHLIDHKTLQNCALVSRSFRSRATHWLFFRTRIEGKGNDNTWIQKRLDKFLEILVANPSIAWSVRELFIQTGPNDSRFWLQDNPTLISVLERLSQVQRFDLRDRHNFKAINWGTLPPKVARALGSIIQSPSLRKLELHDIHEFPCSMLAGCRALKEMSLVRIRASGQHFIAGDCPSVSTVSPVLESACILDAQSTPDFLLSNPMATKMLSQLRTLSVDLCLSLETQKTYNLIIRVAQTLETLNIIDMNNHLFTDDPPYKISLSWLPSLRHLNILRCNVEYQWAGIQRVPYSLCQLLNLQGSTSDIQTIEINVGYEEVELGKEHQILQPNCGWADFDTILADKNYRALKKITLILGIEFTWWDPYFRSTLTDEVLKPLMGKLFPAVRASGRVEMDIHINLSGNDSTT